MNIKLRLILPLCFLICLVAIAHAGTVTLVSDGKNPATLTWNSSPLGATCTAADGWNGSKAVSGAEKLASVTKATTFTLSCTWAADDKASLSWTAPTSNTDGSTPATVDGYDVYQDDSAAPSAATAKKIAGDSSTGGAIPASQLSLVINGLSPGKHNFAVHAWECQTSPCGISALTSFVTKTATAASTAAANVVVNIAAGTPNAPTGLTVAAANTTVYDLTKSNDKLTVKAIGTAPAGTRCDISQPVLGYYVVPRAKIIWSSTVHPQVVVAQCG